MEQNINQEMIDTTDCLEAVSVMKGMKNLFFWLLLLSLLASQGVFWLNRLGLIDSVDCPTCLRGQQAASVPSVGNRDASGLTAPAPLASANVIAERAEQVARQAAAQTQTETLSEQDAAAEPPQTDEQTDSAQAAEIDEDEFAVGFELDFLRLDCIAAVRIIRVANFVMFMAAMLYCLTMLMNLKISLTGKLGGINHISRAFFRSLLALVFVTPWQVLLPGVVLGAMYLPAELLCGGWAKADDSKVWMALYYVRFTGYWLLVVWLLLCAQLRSVKWARATLRRLGMTR